MSDVTQILSAIDRGDAQAAEQLLPLVYDELRKLAASKLAQERAGQTLQPTALVHEAYLRLVGAANVPQANVPQASVPHANEPQANAAQWSGRSHFFAAAAEAMRRILVESARRKGRFKHGGGLHRADLDEAEIASPRRDDQLLAIDDALDQLAKDDAQAAELVKLCYFAGFSLEEAAEMLGLARSTAYAHWAYAKASLRILLALDDD
jgi:RNA polymerase sigma factor (sigma-70 family)